MDKSSNIIRWVVFGILAAITMALAGFFYLTGHSAVATDSLLNWGYILLGLGIVVAIISAIVAVVVAILRGVPVNKMISLCVVVAVLVVLFIVARVLSIDWIDTGLNFFYLTFGFSVLVILFSLIFRAIKK